MVAPIVAARAHRSNPGFSVRSIDMQQLGDTGSPVVVLDEFRVRGRPFPPHPHAGFSAVTYVFEDSESGLRSRSSVGDDVVVGPGGIVWTEAASGVIHEELPADTGRELHGLQVFVNLRSENKRAAPRVLQLENGDVPEWRSDAGDRVRVAVGSFDNVESPLVPAEPFDLLDVDLRSHIRFPLREGRNALVYVLDGRLRVHADGWEQTVTGGHAVGLHGAGGGATFDVARPTHIVVLSGAPVHEPVLVDGPFIMNHRAQIEDAIARYRAGRMGRLAPLADASQQKAEGTP